MSQRAVRPTNRFNSGRSEFPSRVRRGDGLIRLLRQFSETGVLIDGEFHGKRISCFPGRRSRFALAQRRVRECAPSFASLGCCRHPVPLLLHPSAITIELHIPSSPPACSTLAIWLN